MKAGKLVLFFVAGAVFGMGLAISGMTDPGRVIGFLDLFGPGPALRHGRSGWRVWTGYADLAPFSKS
jgi:Family of unknown function (DUF6691)